MHIMNMIKANNEVRAAMERRLRSTSICSFHHPLRPVANPFFSSPFSRSACPIRAQAPVDLYVGGRSRCELSKPSSVLLLSKLSPSSETIESCAKLHGRRRVREKLSWRDEDFAMVLSSLLGNWSKNAEQVQPHIPQERERRHSRIPVSHCRTIGTSPPCATRRIQISGAQQLEKNFGRPMQTRLQLKIKQGRLSRTFSLPKRNRTTDWQA